MGRAGGSSRCGGRRQPGVRNLAGTIAIAIAGVVAATAAAPAQGVVFARPEPLGGGSVMRVEPVTVIYKLEPRPKQKKVPRPERTREPEPAPEPQLPEPELTPQVSLRVISFNVLGSSHTRGRGGRPSGVARIGGAAQLLRGAAVAGLQELQSDQAASLARRLPNYSIFPGNSMGRKLSQNSVIWRSDLFTLLERHTIVIPYHHGRPFPMPYVRLRHVSGAELWVANFHNPATTTRAGNNARWRRVAVQREITLANRLRSTGIPVIFTGDFNDRGEFFCPMARSGMRASNGGSVEGGACRLPGGAPIDWIVGSPDISWSGYVALRGGLVARTSDHPMVAATATLPPQVLNEAELTTAGVPLP